MSQPQGAQKIVPCDCGSREPYWHGPEDGGLRVYCCDQCWKRRGGRQGRALWTLCRVCGLQACYHCPVCSRQVDQHVRMCPADPETNTPEAVLAAVVFVEPALVPTCRVFDCREPVTCLGRYENDDRSWPSCDVHCGHGNEDGSCVLVGRRA